MKNIRDYVIAGFVVAVVLLLLLVSLLPRPDRLNHEFLIVKHPPGASERTLEWTKKKPSQWVPIQGVSKKALWAVVISEDWSFYQHDGFDWEQIEDAMETNWKKRRFVRGASTISQQVVKNVFLSRDKNLVRKLNEAFLTFWMEKTVSKAKILETYFNIAEWGERLYGIGPAASHYFGKDAASLSAREGAYLAMLLPSPIRYSVSFRTGRFPDFEIKIIENILEKLRVAGILTEEEWRAESSSRLPFEKSVDSGENQE